MCAALYDFFFPQTVSSDISDNFVQKEVKYQRLLHLKNEEKGSS